MKRGFTLIEIMVVVVVIAILASMTYFFVGDWRVDTAETEVKSDLSQASNALENYQNFNNAYPPQASYLSAIKYDGSTSVTITYALRADNTYCLNASSKVETTVKWYIDSRQGKQPRKGTCA